MFDSLEVKVPLTTDGGEVIRKGKGVVARRGPGEAWSNVRGKAVLYFQVGGLGSAYAGESEPERQGLTNNRLRISRGT